MSKKHARRIPTPPRDPGEQARLESSTMPPEQSAHAAGEVGQPPVPSDHAPVGEEWTPANTSRDEPGSTQAPGELKTFGEATGIAGATSGGLGDLAAERRAGGAPRDQEDRDRAPE